MSVDDELIPYRVFAHFVLPGQVLDLRAAAAHALQFTGPASPYLTPRDAGHWQWRAPAQPGLYRLHAGSSDSDKSQVLNLLVMRRASEVSNGRLNGYRVGDYPTGRQHRASYREPAGFVEMTADMAEIRLSPHFTLGQFVCKQDASFPKYLALRTDLLVKLERLLEAVNEHGYPAETFHVMSGFRTPAYNASLNNVPFSQHIYGGAADVFIDESPRDGIMDDLNGDGVSDLADVHWLYGVAEHISRAGHVHEGGLGVYRSNSHHGPFLHVDARGSAARWGKLPTGDPLLATREPLRLAQRD